MNNVADTLDDATQSEFAKIRLEATPTAKPHDWCRVVRRLRLSASDRSVKLVGFTLATYADATGGNAAPGERLLAANCALSSRRVRDALWWLRQNLLIDREERGTIIGALHAADRYRLCLPTDWRVRFSLSDEQPPPRIIAPAVHPDPAPMSELVVRQRPRHRTAAPTVVVLYRWYDEDDLLLYIGITGGLGERQDGHAKRSSWADFAVRSNVERFPSRPEAEAAEIAAIEAERPLFNHQHNDTPEARARLVEYLLRKNRFDLLTPAVSRG